MKQLMNEAGNVGMMMALSAGFLLVGIGAAFDYTSASNRQQSVQSFADAAVLAAAASNERSVAKLSEIAKSVVAAQNTDGLTLDVKVSLDADDNIVVDITNDYDTMVMGMMGMSEMPVMAQAASPRAQVVPINMALVLDTTDSMTGAKISALQAAANEMIDELDNMEATVSVSIVPFGKYVNVGTTRKGASWLDVTDDGKSSTAEHCWDETREITPRVCNPTGKTISYDVIKDGVKVGENSYPEQTCTGGDREKTGVNTCEMRTQTWTWHGCVGSRAAPYNTQAEFGTTRINGIMNTQCGSVMTELDANLQNARDTINGLTVKGDTYIPAGIMWGWRTLQQKQPILKSAVVKNKEGRHKSVLQYMVVMTDGNNTLSQGGSKPFKHDNSDTDAANLQTAALCEAAKADGITIFTVGYQINGKDGEDTRELLKACATSNAYFYRAKNSGELKKAFKDISGQLGSTRLAY